MFPCCNQLVDSLEMSTIISCFSYTCNILDTFSQHLVHSHSLQSLIELQFYNLLRFTTLINPSRINLCCPLIVTSCFIFAGCILPSSHLFPLRFSHCKENAIQIQVWENTLSFKVKLNSCLVLSLDFVWKLKQYPLSTGWTHLALLSCHIK